MVYGVTLSNTSLDVIRALCDTLVMSPHRRRLKRIETPNHIRYLTCSCYHRLRLFNNDRIKQIFVDQLDLTRRRLGFELYAWVVMPEHFHLLIRPGCHTLSRVREGKVCDGAMIQPGCHTLSRVCEGKVCSNAGHADPPQPVRSGATVTDILRALKRPFAKKVLDRWRSLDAPILTRVTDARGHAHFWQQGGGYDRNLFTANEVFEKIDYIHDNPRRRRLVERAIDWPWSSMRWYETRTGPSLTMDPLPT